MNWSHKEIVKKDKSFIHWKSCEDYSNNNNNNNSNNEGLAQNNTNNFQNFFLHKEPEGTFFSDLLSIHC